MIGELYAGVGGLGLAAEWALGGTTAWQLDQVGEQVRRRHWPDALQVVGDVADVDPMDLPPITTLVGGFACQDLSVAGSRKGLVEGERTGPTYRHLCRFTQALRPYLVVMENVPALLTKWRDTLESDWASLGYGLTWVRCGAWDAGAPHIRRRVFVVATLGGAHRGVIDAPPRGRWSDTEQQCWPTPTAGDAKASRSRSLSNNAHDGTSLTDAVRPDRSVAGERCWATPTAANPNEGEDPESFRLRSERCAQTSRPVSEPLGQQVRTRATPTARDYKVGQVPNRTGGDALSEQAAPGKRLNAEWVEHLMGYPEGWTLPEGPRLYARESATWPRGRYPKDWDRAVPWPGYDWEPPRTLPDGPPVPGRPARLKALGNAACPQQGALAIRAALGLTW